MWVKLTLLNKKTLFHGVVLRFPAQYPYEDYVDFMVFEPVPYESCMGLIVTTGQKAGLIANILPVEATSIEGRGIDVAWLIGNWEAWVYQESRVEDVLVLESYYI